MSIYSVGGHGYHKPQYHGLGGGCGVYNAYGAYGLGSAAQALEAEKVRLTLGTSDAKRKVEDIEQNFKTRSMDLITRVYGETILLYQSAVPYLNKPFSKSYTGYASWEELGDSIRQGEKTYWGNKPFWADSGDINEELDRLVGLIKRLQEQKSAEKGIKTATATEDAGMLVQKSVEVAQTDPPPLPPKDPVQKESFEKEEEQKAKLEDTAIAQAGPAAAQFTPEQLQMQQAALMASMFPGGFPTAYPKPAPKPPVTQAQVIEKAKVLAEVNEQEKQGVEIEKITPQQVSQIASNVLPSQGVEFDPGSLFQPSDIWGEDDWIQDSPFQDMIDMEIPDLIPTPEPAPPTKSFYEKNKYFIWGGAGVTALAVAVLALRRS